MSSLPISFSIEGTPASFGNAYAGFDTVVGHTVTGPTDGRCYIIQGIDAFVSITAGTADAWYNLDGVGTQFFWSASVDPADLVPHKTGLWRGAHPLGNGDTFHIGVESTLPCELGISAFGLVVPYELAGHF